MRPFNTAVPRTVNCPLTVFSMLLICGVSSGPGVRIVAHHLVARGQQRVQIVPRQTLAIQRVLHQRIHQRLARDVFGERAVRAQLAGGRHVCVERRFQPGQLHRRERRRDENWMAGQRPGHIQGHVADVIIRCFGESGVDAEVSYRCIGGNRYGRGFLLSL